MNLRIVSMLVVLLGLAALAAADVITFTNGAAVRGTFLGGDARTIRIEVNNQVQTYRISEVASILFGDGSPQAAGAAGAAGAAMQAAQVQAPAVQAPQVQVPQVQAPAVQAPALQAPQVQAPQVQAPAVQAPQVQAPPAPKRGLFGRKPKAPPEVQAPQVQAPQVQAPQVQAPQVQMPQVQAPQVPAPAVAAPPQPVAVAPQPISAPPQPVSAPQQPVAAPQAAATAPPGTAPVPVMAQQAAAAPAAAPATPAPATVPAPAQTVPIGGADGRTIPVGALLQLRMIDTIDSSVHQPGETFRANLEAELAAAGDSLLPRGSDVTVRLVQIPASAAGARPMFRLEAVAVRVEGRNLPVAAEGLPSPDPTSAPPTGAGLAKLVIASDGLATFRVTRAFRVP
ncbi:MAG: hypothetical protein KIT83_08750 [Bryobacterales bacterium]|nr:hypothetical protein [Bryobacterales bacterium]